MLTDITHIANMGVAQAESPKVTVNIGFRGCRVAFTYQIIREVYSTIPAITTVRINPGTNPRTE